MLRGLEPNLVTWAAPERIRESTRKTLALIAGVPLVGLVVDGAWAYYALQVLGESTAATFAMAFVFGWAGVLVAHLAGVLARHARAGSQRARLMLVLVCVGSLLAMALFLADARLAYLQAPIIAAGHTYPS